MLVQVLVQPEIPFRSKQQNATRAGVCVQAAGQVGQVPLQQHPLGVMTGCRESVALVRAMGRCVPEPGGVVLGSLLPRD